MFQGFASAFGTSVPSFTGTASGTSDASSSSNSKANRSDGGTTATTSGSSSSTEPAERPSNSGTLLGSLSSTFGNSSTRAVPNFDFKSFADDAAKLAQKTAANAAAKAREAAQLVQEEYRATFEEQLTKIVDVIPRKLLIMEFPAKEDNKLERLANRLNRSHGSKYLVLNMSEHSYDTKPFQGEVMDVRFRGLPSPPLELFFKLVISVKQWLDTGKEHVVVVHCFSGFTRSAMFCACYLYWCSYCQSTQRGLEYTLRRLKVPSQILPTQKRYMEYFETVLTDGQKAADAPKYLTRVLITGIPNFSNSGGGAGVAQRQQALGAATTPAGDVGNKSKASNASASETTEQGKVAPFAAGDNSDAGGKGAQHESASSSSTSQDKAAEDAQASTASKSDKDESKLGDSASSASGSAFFGKMSSTFETFRSSSKESAPKLFSNFQKDFSSTFKNLQKEVSTSSAKIFQQVTTAAAASPLMTTGGNSLQGAGGGGSDPETSSTTSAAKEPIFVPYLEIWHKEKMLYSSWNSLDPATSPAQEYYTSDSCVPFTLKDAEKFLCPSLDGDVLVRVRHYDKKTKQKSSAFRLGFNTNYVSGNFLHFPNTELDTATMEFPRDGFVDLFFEEDGAKKKTKETLSQEAEVFQRARQLFEEIKAEETERLRQQVLLEKENKNIKGRISAHLAGDHSSDAGSVEERMQTEEEFDRLQRQLLEDAELEQGAGGEASPTIQNLDTTDMYEMSWAQPGAKGQKGDESRGGKKEEAKSVAGGGVTENPAASSTTTPTSATASGSAAGNVQAFDMTTPKSATSTPEKSAEEKTAPPPPPPPPAVVAVEAPADEVAPPAATSKVASSPGAGDEDLLDSLMQDTTSAPSPETASAEKKTASANDELDDLLTLM
ncbi:unnamed protein product [Amoebophrya sp. A120]|nr:unnamed protein product [Amoebophrya sp. A120]|eukprot:GSA120T00005372001.1